MKNKVDNEKGMVLIMALMILSLLTVLSIGAVMSTNTDLQISANLRTHQETFYNTEGSMDIVPGVIRRTISIQTESPTILASLGITDANGDGISDNEDSNTAVFKCVGADPAADPAPPPCGLLRLDDPDDADDNAAVSDFSEYILGYTANEPPDFTIINGSQTTTVDTKRLGLYELEGFSTGFGTGYEGGALSGKTINFGVTGTGTGNRNSQTQIALQYRCVERSGGGCW